MNVRRISPVVIAIVMLSATGLLKNAKPAEAKPEFVVESWGGDQGLSQNSVLVIFQSRDGYFWLGTYSSISRFDGVRFTTFDPGVTPGLSGNRVLAICEDREGTVWMATENDGIVAYRHGVFRTYTTQDGLPSNRLFHVIVDHEGTVWATTVKGLVRFDRVTGRFKRVNDIPCSELAESRDGHLWVSSGARVLEIFRGTVVAEYATATEVVSLYVDSSGNLWAGATGLFRLDAAHNCNPWISTPVQGRVRSILEDSQHTMWAASDTGLWRENGEEWMTYGNRDGLPENFVRSVFEDNENNLWIGTDGHGLSRLKPKRVKVIAAGPELPKHNTLPVLEDRRGAIWIGIACGGLVKYESGRYQIFGKKEGLTNLCVKALAEDHDGNIWLGTTDGLGLIKDGRIRMYMASESIPYAGGVVALLEDREGLLWIGASRGLYRLKNGAYTLYTKSQGLVDNDIRYLGEDRDGSIWIGTIAGMSRFHDGKFENYTTANGLPNAAVRAIYCDGEGTVWIGTYGGGLARLRNGRFAYFNTQNGLPENLISQILEDDRGDLWLGGKRGIHRVSRAQLNAFAGGQAASYDVFTYGASDGMLSMECNGNGTPAGWKTRDGTLLIPTTQGVVEITPSALKTNPHPPQVAIEEVLVSRKPAEASRGIHLPPGGGDLEIHYTGLSPTTPERVRFEYKLAGLDAEWVDAGSRRFASYSHLPAGDYQFTVIAANGDGIWNRTGAALEFSVAPFFWATWWFRLICAVAAVFMVWAAYQWRVRLVTTRLHLQFKERLAERERIARELHDTLLQGFQGLILRFQAVAKKIPADDPTRRLMDRALSRADDVMVEGRDRVKGLRASAESNCDLPQALSTAGEELAQGHPAAFRVVVEGTPRNLHPMVRDEAYQIGREALANAFCHGNSRVIEVEISYDTRELRLRFQDDGQGIDPKILQEGGRPAHWGLRGMRERAQKIGARLDICSRPGAGTEIELRVPASVAYGGNGSAANWVRRLATGGGRR